MRLPPDGSILREKCARGVTPAPARPSRRRRRDGGPSSGLSLIHISAGLDPRGRDEILGLVRDYHAKTQGMVIMVSHSMDDMARMADLLVVMNHGRVAMQGTPREIFSQSEQLRQIGLGVPAVVRLGDMLRERGVPVPKDVLTIQEMEQALLALYRGEGKA